jgi:PST family polysaccharide transporter
MSTPPDEVDLPQPAPGPSLGQRAARGMGWMIVNAGLTRGLSFFAQIALGWFLSKDDFGIYAIATAMAAIASTLRDAGLRQVLIQREPEYPTLIGPIFWLAGGFNIAAALIIAALAYPTAQKYGHPELLNMMLVIAASVPLSTPAAVLSAKLQMDLKFGALSAMATVSCVLRYGGTVLLAWLGMGPISFVLPLIAISIFESAFTVIATGEHPWTRSPNTRLWPQLLKDSGWVMAGTLSTQLMVNIPFAVVGALASETVTGVYFWAYQLVAQLGLVLSANLQQVLFPALTKLRNEPERERAAVLRSVRLIAFFTGPLSVGISCIYTPLELVIWHGKWADAAPAVQVLGLVYTVHVVLSVATALQLARGWFRAWTLVLGLGGVGAVAAVALGAISSRWLSDTTSVSGASLLIAIATASYILLGQFALTCLALRPIGLLTWPLIKATMPATIFNAAIAIGVIALDKYALATLPPIVRLALCFGLFSIVWLVLSRLFMHHTLREVLSLVPARLGAPARRVLALG